MNNEPESLNELSNLEIHDLLFLVYDLIEENPEIKLTQIKEDSGLFKNWILQIKNRKKVFDAKAPSILQDWVKTIINELIRIEYTRADRLHVFSTIIGGVPFSLRRGQ